MFKNLYGKHGVQNRNAQQPKLTVTSLESREVPATLNVGEGFAVDATPVDEGATLVYRVSPIVTALSNFNGNNFPVGVSYATTDSSARVSDRDYTAASGTLQWAAGDRTTKEIRVPTTHDLKHEGDEGVQINLTGIRYGLQNHHTFGRFVCQSVAASYILAMRNIFSSSNGGDSSCSPIGRPPFVKPHGMLSPAMPARLHEIV